MRAAASGRRVPRAFFERDVVEVARDLVGRHLVLDEVALEITETEAYRWPGDTACHGRHGRTARNAALWGPPGHAYVYLCYGLHQMLNLVVGPEGECAAVLIRSAAPVRGLDRVRERRGGRSGPSLLDGPGKLGAALGLDRRYDGHDVCAAGGLELRLGTPPGRLRLGPRVGIDYADPAHVVLPWRFAHPDSAWVSHPGGLSLDPGSASAPARAIRRA